MNKYWIIFFYTFIISFHVNGQSLYEPTTIHDIKITFKEANWDSKLDSFMQNNSSKRLVSTVFINGVKYEKVGIKYKGNSSYNNVRKQGKAKLPLNFDANYIIKNQTFADKLASLKLSNMFRDPSCIREVLAYELACNYMIAPRANFAKVTINNKNLGVYTNTESIDKLFLKERFGDKNGILIKCDPNWDSEEPSFCPKGDKAALLFQGLDSNCYVGNYELKTDYGYSKFIDFIKNLNQQPKTIDKQLDVDKTLWMHAFNHILVNMDSYSGRLSHNYYMYYDSTQRWVPIVWDMNLAFGGFRIDGKKLLTDDEIYNYPILEHSMDPSRPLISKLIENALYKKILVAHARTIYDDWFANDKLSKRIDIVGQAISSEVQKDANPLYGFGMFKQNLESKSMLPPLVKGGAEVPIVGLKDFVENRKYYLQKYFSTMDPPEIISCSNEKDSLRLIISVKAANTTQLHLFYANRKHPEFRYVKVSNHSSEKNEDWTIEIPVTECDSLRYYVVAENLTSATTFPAAASLKPIILSSVK